HEKKHFKSTTQIYRNAKRFMGASHSTMALHRHLPCYLSGLQGTDNCMSLVFFFLSNGCASNKTRGVYQSAVCMTVNEPRPQSATCRTRALGNWSWQRSWQPQASRPNRLTNGLELESSGMVVSYTPESSDDLPQNAGS